VLWARGVIAVGVPRFSAGLGLSGVLGVSGAGFFWKKDVIELCCLLGCLLPDALPPIKVGTAGCSVGVLAGIAAEQGPPLE
jgi:hypothetical protein